jgi:hypothetical protein
MTDARESDAFRWRICLPAVDCAARVTARQSYRTSPDTLTVTGSAELTSKDPNPPSCGASPNRAIRPTNVAADS